MAPANTGSLTISSTAVIATLHKNKGKRDRVRTAVIRETKIVVKKLILPKIDEIPAK
jgi:hypothetical protein